MVAGDAPDVVPACDRQVEPLYDAPANATTDLLVTDEGRNERFAGGWRGDYFRETAGTAVRGDGPGRVAVSGNETVGVGTYRGAPDPAVAVPVSVPGPATGAARAPAPAPAG